MKMRRWLGEPLAHFLAAGVSVFLLVSWLGPNRYDERTIRVTRDDVLAHMQAQARVYDAETFDRVLAAMQPDERRQLIRDVAIQLALYREGQAIGLSQADPLIRQRIVQQTRLLVMDQAAADVSVSDAELAEYYGSHGEAYRTSAMVSFTHAFFSTAEHGDGAKRLAEAELAGMRAERTPFENAARRGDRFLYQTNYIGADRPLIASHFGAKLAHSLFETEPDETWQGPFRSDHGWHVVMLRSRSESRLPPLSEILDRVRDDALAAKRDRLTVAALDGLLVHYRVELEPGIEW